MLITSLPHHLKDCACEILVSGYLLQPLPPSSF